MGRILYGNENFPCLFRAKQVSLKLMKTQIVSIENDKIILSTSLHSDAFGRTQYTQEIDEAGFVATVPLHTDDCDGVTFDRWKFDGTQTDTDDIAAYVGKSFGAGKTLYEIFESGDAEKIKQAAWATCSALTSALSQKIPMDAVGAEGIVVSLQEDCATVQFMPAQLFDRSALNTRGDYADFQGFFIRKGVVGAESLLFTRAVIAYRALCGTLPFSERDLSKRQADIFDANFTPSYMLVNGLDAHLISAIDCGLQVSAELKPLPGERRFVNEKDVAKRKKIISAAERFSLSTFKAELESSSRKPEISESDFSARREQFLKKQKTTVRRRRFLRRNHNRIIVGAVAVILGAWAVISFHRGNQQLATTKGLTSWQTTQALYATIHRSNVPHLQEIAKGKKMKNLRQIVSGFYVTNRSRFTMNQDEATVSPAEWLFLKNKTNFWMYGLTQLAIDGTEADENFAYPTRGDHPQPLTEENGVTLRRSQTVSHTAEYYLINNDDARININKTTDTVTLTWKRNRWIVTEIKSKSQPLFVFTKNFKADFQNALNETGNDVFKATDILREKYEWIPAEKSLQSGETLLKSRFSLPF